MALTPLYPNLPLMHYTRAAPLHQYLNPPPPPPCNFFYFVPHQSNNYYSFNPNRLPYYYNCNSSSYNCFPLPSPSTLLHIPVQKFSAYYMPHLALPNSSSSIFNSAQEQETIGSETHVNNIKLEEEKAAASNKEEEEEEGATFKTTTTTLMIRNIPNKFEYAILLPTALCSSLILYLGPFLVEFGFCFALFCSQKRLLKLLDEHCRNVNKRLQVEGGTKPEFSEFDFLYLPMDFR